jgi:hypothetical protein
VSVLLTPYKVSVRAPAYSSAVELTATTVCSETDGNPSPFVSVHQVEESCTVFSKEYSFLKFI